MDDGVRFPAADDNASGVVDLLELARVISDYSLSRTVVLFFDTGEEQDGRAASSYLNQLSPQELNAIRDVITIDMVGYDANRDGVMELWLRRSCAIHGPNSGVQRDHPELPAQPETQVRHRL